MSMRTMAALAVTILISTMLFSVVAGQDERPEPNLKGKLYDQEDGAPLSGMVIIKGGPEQSFALTIEVGEDGLFNAAVPPGVWHVVAEARGYQRIEQRFEIVEGEVLGLRLKMIPVEKESEPAAYGVVHGMAVNFEGDPLPGVFILFEPIPNDRIPVDPPVPVELETGRDGTFKTRLAFGLYLMNAMRDDHHPVTMELAVTPENPEVGVMIEMEPAHVEEPADIDVHMEYIDSDSDGIPEMVNLTVDIDMDEEADLELLIIDRNSDGNPESVVFDMNIPLHMMERIIEMIRMRTGMVPPFLEDRYGEEWEDERHDRDPCFDHPEEGRERARKRMRERREAMDDRDPDERRERHRDRMDERREDHDHHGDPVDEEPQADDEDTEPIEDPENDSNREKSSILPDDGPLPGFLLAGGILVLIIAILAITGIAINLKRKNGY